MPQRQEALVLAQHAVAFGVFDQADTTDRGFGPARLDTDEVDRIAVVILVAQLGLATLDRDFPVEHLLAPRILGPQAELLEPVNDRRIVDIARFVIDPQLHDPTSKR